ncbi:MAG TPA: DUF6644 family protein [Sphingomonadaceae bacterium]|nr:DUF6644 family protein [Sphingomonadaceae bacterium]
MGGVLDFLYRLTEWLREATLLPEFSLWVTDWPLAIWLQEHFLAIPGFQTIHILAIAALFGSVLMLNLRVLGKKGMDLSLADAFSRYRAWTWWSLAALVLSGVILLISEPVRNMVNSVFWLKMIALFLAVTVSLWFQGSVRRNMARIEASPQGVASIRVGAWAVIVLWLIVMTGGRWIAYSPN